MKVPAEIMNIWGKHYEHGDVAEIARVSKLSDTTISTAINHGKCSSKTFQAINKYFLAKKLKMESLVDSTIKKFQPHETQ